MTRRRLLAAVIAPPTGAVVACLGFVVTGVLALGPMLNAQGWVEGFAHWLGFYLLFGVPLAYVVEAGLLALQPPPAGTASPSLRRTLITTAVLGGALVGAVWGLMFGLSFGLIVFPSGALGGAAAGGAFWLAGLRREALAPAI